MVNTGQLILIIISFAIGIWLMLDHKNKKD